MNWNEFAEAAPELAKAGEERFEKWGLSLVGTVRKDGSARISPVEPLIVDGELMLGMMWQSTKAKDLMRDPRVLVHSIISDRKGDQGEFKLRGTVADVVHDETRRLRYCEELRKKIDWAPEGVEWHLFVVDIKSAALIAFEGDAKSVQMWP
ncbi:MAG TPA: hypothetical protein VMR52_10525 [Dehalococcoidia bacterium]|nr:hypothetical protein [Dehalococcoidia bacterium]